MKVCIVGISGKLGQYMLRHCLDRGYTVVGVCRPESIVKLAAFGDSLKLVPGRTNDKAVIREAVAGCDGVLTVLAPWGVEGYSSGTAQAVLNYSEEAARLIFSCGWHISKDGKDQYSLGFLLFLSLGGWVARALRFVDINDQVEACRRIFQSNRRWTVVRASDLEEGESEGLPIWRDHVGDPALKSNRTRRVDFGLFMVNALTDDSLVQKTPAIVSCQSPSALAHR